jgi:hypothetical protein
MTHPISIDIAVTAKYASFVKLVGLGFGVCTNASAAG